MKRHVCKTTGCLNWNLPSEPHCVTHRTTVDETLMAKITMEDICKAIEAAVVATKAFKGTRDELIVQVINPLQSTLKAGTEAGLTCSEKRVKSLFRQLKKAFKYFDESASERAMRLSAKKR